MRVLIVTDWYPAVAEDPAGSFVRAQALAVASRHDVTVLHLSGGTGPLRAGQDGALRTLRPGVRRPRLPATAANLASVLAAVRGHGVTPDLVHAHGFSAGLAGLALARARHVPLVVSEHSSAFATGTVGRTGRLVARLVFAGSDLVCPVSLSQRRVLVAAGHRGPFRVVPNPVDVDLFTLDGAAPVPGPRAVAVGSLRPVKGVADLVEALALVAGAGRELELDLVGDGPLRGELEERARSLGLRVTFHGTLAPPAVADRLHAASFAVVPSRWETFSVALSEALACGLPVVATTAGGLPERIHDGNGILCPPGDPPRLAAALEQMLERLDSFDRRAIAAEAREALAPTAIARRWDEVYEEARSLRRWE